MKAKCPKCGHEFESATERGITKCPACGHEFVVNPEVFPSAFKKIPYARG